MTESLMRLVAQYLRLILLLVLGVYRLVKRSGRDFIEANLALRNRKRRVFIVEKYVRVIFGGLVLLLFKLLVVEVELRQLRATLMLSMLRHWVSLGLQWMPVLMRCKMMLLLVMVDWLVNVVRRVVTLVERDQCGSLNGRRLSALRHHKSLMRCSVLDLSLHGRLLCLILDVLLDWQSRGDNLKVRDRGGLHVLDRCVRLHSLQLLVALVMNLHGRLLARWHRRLILLRRWHDTRGGGHRLQDSRRLLWMHDVLDLCGLLRRRRDNLLRHLQQLLVTELVTNLRRTKSMSLRLSLGGRLHIVVAYRRRRRLDRLSCRDRRDIYFSALLLAYCSGPQLMLLSWNLLHSIAGEN